MNKAIKWLTLLSKILFHICTVLFGVVLVGGMILEENSEAISTILGQRSYIMVEAEDDGSEAPIYFNTDKKSVAEMKKAVGDLVREVTEEGVALLKNEGVLPVAQGTTLSLFSVSSVDMVYVGSGSSSIDISGAVKLDAGLKEAGLQINQPLWDWYTANRNTYWRGAAGNVFGHTFPIKDAAWSQIATDAKSDKEVTKGGLAVFVLARNGGEGADLAAYGGSATDFSNGDYLQLNPNEKDVLAHLKEQKDAGVFSGIAVLINSAYAVQCDFADDPAYGIDAVLWVGNFGTTGAYAVGDILVGNVNPSGRISDTFWKSNRLNPVLTNFGAFDYNEKLSPAGVEKGNTDKYVVYQEGIYNGYRYTETRYEDYVLEQGNAGDYNYAETVAYPFGAGMSYTTFSYDAFDLDYDEVKDEFTASVHVTNTGDIAGREAVQIYLQKPYTQYDVKNSIEKASVELVGFGKTGLLEPKGDETVTVKIAGELLASYDAYKAETFILDEGTYYFTAARDAHDAINNILEVRAKEDQKERMTGRGDAALVASKKLSFDAVKYSVSPTTKAEVTNRFENADLNLYEGAGANFVDYITRDDWTASVKYATDEQNRALNQYVHLTVTQQMKEDVELPTIEEDDVAYPTYGSTATAHTLVDLRHAEIAYDDEAWEELLDQLTWEETVTLLSSGCRKTVTVASIGKPETIDHNGANGPNRAYNNGGDINMGFAVKNNDPDKSSLPIIYPCNGLVASAFDEELIERFGTVMGEDCLWAGYNGLYGLGINIHRSAYGGRAFEYFSEDPVLSGGIVAAEVRGIQSKGVYCYMKHCMLNDMENNREGISVWANEQTIREIYLRPFEIAIEQGGAYNVMTGFNRIGLEWTGEQGFLNNVLRGEFGMRGFAVTDWYDERTWYMTSYGGILGGNDLPDGQYLASSANNLDRYREHYGTLAWAMRESAHRILYTVAHSSAMNGYKPGTRIVSVTPAWVGWLKTARTVSYILFGVSAALFAAMIALGLVYKKKN